MIPTDIQKVPKNSSLPTPRETPEIIEVPTTEPQLSVSIVYSNRATVVGIWVHVPAQLRRCLVA
jgi:hypothetical protein